MILKVTRKFISNIADGLIGIPYKKMGRNVTNGLDCFGLVIEFYRRMGIDIEDPVKIYSDNWFTQSDFISENQFRSFIAEENPSPGCVVSMKVESVVPNHLAIMVDDSYLLNTDMGVGSSHKLRLFTIKNRINNYLRSKQLEVIS
jgi:cell wall-associated NlpC family hydrolase